MKFLEKDLEDVIFSADKEMLAERGLDISGILRRQFNLGNYGICDLLEFSKPIFYESEQSYTGEGYHGSYNITIYELKKEQISMSSFLQCIRYAKGVKSYFEKRNLDVNIYIVLIGKNIDLNSDFIYLADFMHNLSFYTYDYEFDGIKFKKHKGYELVNDGFKIKNNGTSF